MGNIFSTDENDIVTAMITYIENSPIEHPIDEVVAKQLAACPTLTDAFGGAAEFLESLRDRPVLTLLKALKFIDED